jgi:hypothetical protein
LRCRTMRWHHDCGATPGCMFNRAELRDIVEQMASGGLLVLSHPPASTLMDHRGQGEAHICQMRQVWGTGRSVGFARSQAVFFAYCWGLWSNFSLHSGAQK